MEGERGDMGVGTDRDVQLRSGFPLFFQQTNALLKKNALLSWTSKRATFLQLVASFFFILLIFAVDKSVTATNRDTTDDEDLKDPETTPVTAIPQCEDGFLIKTSAEGCFDFLYTPNDNAQIDTLVDRIRANNPGRPIPAEKTRGFVTPEDADVYLRNNPMRIPAGVHFQLRANGIIAYGIQTNSTPKTERGKYEDPNFKFQIPLQNAVEREMVRLRVGNPNLGWNVNFTEFAHPNVQTYSTVGTIGPTNLLAAVMFGFVTQIGNIVGEKELRLRQTMAVMGLNDSAYWLSWLLWEVVLAFVSSLLLVVFGMIFQFYFFLNNNFFVLFFMFFLFSLNMTTFAFLLSVFVGKASSATTAGFFVFIIAFLLQLVTLFGFPYDDSFSKSLQYIWSIFPPNLFTIGIQYLGDATATKEDEGISWAGRDKCSFADTDCQFTMDQIFKWLAVTFAVWFALAVYLDNVVPDVNGVRKPWTYFLRPSYWTGRGSNTYESGGLCTFTKSAIPEPEPGETKDVDVAEEERLVKDKVEKNVEDPSVAVQLQGLRKSFPGKTQLVRCCRLKRTRPYHAVRGAWYNVERGKLFCLLGPNGAGKTTTINCLTGIVPTTDGNAVIDGDSIRSTIGMRKIRGRMGVCPQFDILWQALSGQEHLELFGVIKGLKPSDAKSSAQLLLLQAKLREAAKVRSGSYSGGMKRRLSLAIALIGNPRILFLDEPTTGMDPITRRHVWDIIEASKESRAIILTTHSMEEADILGDRVAIMARGRLRCIGTPLHLKNRFGAGYVVNVSVRNEDGRIDAGSAEEEESRRVHVKAFFWEELGVDCSGETRAYIKFVVPREKEGQLTGFFQLLSREKHRMGISDVQIGLSTLDEVFLNISKQAELEMATAEGRFDTLTLSSGPFAGKTIKVLTGAPSAVIPGSESAEEPNGMMVEVYWQQDDIGSLCISGHSEAMTHVPSAKPLDGVDEVPPTYHYDAGEKSLSRSSSRNL